MRITLLVAPAIFVFALPIVGLPLQVTVTVPARVVDGDPIAATVTVRASDRAAFHGPWLQNRESLILSVVPISGRSERCITTRHSVTGARDSGRSLDLAPGEATSVDIDVLSHYPLGLGPGTYRVSAEYRLPNRQTARSGPAQFEIVAPAEGGDAERYRQFVLAANMVRRRDPSAGEAALVFAKKYPDFRFTPELLNRAALVTRSTQLRSEIDTFLTATYPHTDACDSAQRDADYLARREAAIRNDEEHQKQLAAELSRPQNKDAAAAFAKLGSIINAEGWQRHEDFLSQFSQSPFAAEALYDMVAAATNGVLPPGKTSGDRDALIRELRARLLTEYPQSFHAQQVRGTRSMQ